MRLSAKAITTYNQVNSFVTGNQWTVRSGEPNTLYFQIVDLDQAGLRYIVGVGQTDPSVVTVSFPSLEEDNVITATATQVDPLDGSLWKVELTATQVPSSGNVVFGITEGTTTRRFSVINLLSVENPNASGACC